MARFDFTKKRELTAEELTAVRYVGEYVAGLQSFYEPHFKTAAQAARDVITDESEAKFIGVCIERIGKGYAYNRFSAQDMIIQLIKN